MLCRNAVDWLYRLDRTFTWESGLALPHDLAFRDKQGTVRLVIETSGRITVMRGYAWNGCSPKFCVLDILIGTPDGVVHAGTGKPKAYYASLVHDALYQFLPVAAPVAPAVPTAPPEAPAPLPSTWPTSWTSTSTKSPTAARWASSPPPSGNRAPTCTRPRRSWSCTWTSRGCAPRISPSSSTTAS